MSIVGEEYTFRISGKTAPTRTLKSAMTERLCTFDADNPDERGKPTPEYIKLYEEWGKGKIGVIVLGNIPVSREHPEAAKNAIIDAHSPWDAVEAFKPVFAAARAHGSLVLGQTTHGGRQVPEEVNKNPVSSSDVRCPPGYGVIKFAKPRPMTVQEIDEVVKAWGHAAEVLYKAGADGIQLHCAHGYLLSQFLSGRVNRRTDDHGGSLENRYRIIERIIEEVQARVPDERFMLAVKINSADFSDGRMTFDESRQVCEWLDAAGLDLIELLGGTFESLAFEHKKESTKKGKRSLSSLPRRSSPPSSARPSASRAGSGPRRRWSKPSRRVRRISSDSPDHCAASRSRFARSSRAIRTVPSRTCRLWSYGVLSDGLHRDGKPISDLSNDKVAQEIVLIATGQKQPEEKPVAEQDNEEPYPQTEDKA